MEIMRTAKLPFEERKKTHRGNNPEKRERQKSPRVNNNPGCGQDEQRPPRVNNNSEACERDVMAAQAGGAAPPPELRGGNPAAVRGNGLG